MTWWTHIASFVMNVHDATRPIKLNWGLIKHRMEGLVSLNASKQEGVTDPKLTQALWILEAIKLASLRLTTQMSIFGVCTIQNVINGCVWILDQIPKVSLSFIRRGHNNVPCSIMGYVSGSYTFLAPFPEICKSTTNQTNVFCLQSLLLIQDELI